MYELALRCLEADPEIFNPMSVKHNVYNVKMLVNTCVLNHTKERQYYLNEY